MAIHTNTSLGLELAESLGLETKNLNSFTLEVGENDNITVTAKYYVTNEDATGFVAQVRKFNLNLKEQ